MSLAQRASVNRKSEDVVCWRHRDITKYSVSIKRAPHLVFAYNFDVCQPIFILWQTYTYCNKKLSYRLETGRQQRISLQLRLLS